MLLTHTIIKIVTVGLILCGCCVAVVAQAQRGELRGQIKDDFGGAIVRAEVSLENSGTQPRQTQTDQQGYFSFKDLSAGTYKLVARANGFAPYENSEVVISGNRIQQLNLKLEVAIMSATVTVDETAKIG